MSGISTYTSDYTIFRGAFGLTDEIWAGEYNLAEYHYTNDRKYNLSALDYGNSDRVEYTYDDKDRLTKETFEDGDTVTYFYNNDGELAVVTDSATGITTKYYYDLIGRLVKQEETGGNRNYSVQYTYDSLNNLESLKETINGTDHTSNYTYDEHNRVESVTNGVSGEHYTYDSFSRVEQSVTKNGNTNVLTESYTFTAPSANATSGQIATNRLQATGYDVTYSYTYDDNGNILSISDGTYTTSYVYDSANQLIRENNQAGGFTHTWEYDQGGNILNRKEYTYTTGTLGTPTDTVTYTYDDEMLWGDLLYSYDGQNITFDGIGNTLYDGTWTYAWEHGRELATMSNGAATWSFTYDANGMRTKRTNGGTTYQYIYNGSSLSQMTVGSNTLYFAYGANGVPMSVTYNGTTYYYVTNIQGDVIAILNAAGTPVVRYGYDAWGNPLSTTGSMASTLGAYNPLRYRGYVFDQELGLYYLQSRYYNPQWGRFINADSLITTSAVLGQNLFAYCYNNPVKLSDHTGQIPFADDPFAETYQEIGEWLSPYIQPFIKNFIKSLAGSWNASVEFGSGFGAKGKVGPVSVEADAIIVADEWSFDADGKTNEVRKASITIQAELIDNINLGVDASYYVPLEAGEEYGLLCAPGGEADVVIGAYVYDFGIGYKTISTQAIEISFGLSGYFILGGGFEVGVNLSEFIRIWNS